MKRLCDFSAESFVALWHRNRTQYDDLAEAPNVHREYLSYADQSGGIRSAIEATRFWRESKPAFFAEHPYRWMSEPQSYDFSAEAAFQVRAIELLIPIWERRDDYPVTGEYFGEIATRKTVAPAVFHSTPRAVQIEGHGFILMPLGWFDTFHYAIEAVRQHHAGNPGAVLSLVLEAILRTLADQCINELAALYVVHQTVAAVLRPDIVRAMTVGHPVFSKAAGELAPGNSHPGLWGELLYAAASFALAHEAAHILTGEHLVAATDANEKRADDIAFDMAVRCEAWQDRLTQLPAATSIGKTCVAIAAFLFGNGLRLQIDRFLTAGSDRRFNAFKERASYLELVAGAQQFPDTERQSATHLARLCTEIREFAISLLERIGSPQLAQLRATGIDAGIASLKEQAVLGGVSGL